MWLNANGERIEKIEARENAAADGLAMRGTVIRDCPHCGLPLEVPTDGTPATCDYDHNQEYGCGADVTISECAE